MNLKRIMAAVILCMCTHISYGAGKDALDRALWQAARKNDDKQVAELLSQGANPLYKSYGGVTVFNYIMQPRSERGESLLGKARGSYKIFKLMFEHITPEQRKEVINESFVSMAFMGGDKQIITDLLATKPDNINMQNVFNHMQILPYDQELWDLALKAGAQIDATDSTGKTPLEAAIKAVIQDYAGAEENVKALIKAGATVNSSYTVLPFLAHKGFKQKPATKLEDVTADNLLSKVLKFAGRPEIVIEENKGAGGAGAAGR